MFIAWESPFLDTLQAQCEEAFDAPTTPELYPLALRLMGESLPMHCPEHHFIVPATLLTVCHALSGDTAETLHASLTLARERAQKVSGGFCGLQGTCGAAVGVGIFFSVFGKVTPLSRRGWTQANLATADALRAIAQAGGPRCCKRVVTLALRSAVQSVETAFGLTLPFPAEIQCGYVRRNPDCLGAGCPFFPKKAASK